MNVTNPAALIEDIIKELTRLETVPMSERSMGDDFSLPRMIDAGNGGSLVISRKLDEDIGRVARKLMDDDPTLKPKFTQAEWRAMVRRAFGPALVSIDLDDNLAMNASIVLDLIKASLGQEVTGNGLREYSFGCTLFGPAKNFTIFDRPGSVRDQRRLACAQAPRRRHIGNFEGAHRAGMARQEVGKRKPSFDSISEADGRGDGLRFQPLSIFHILAPIPLK